MREFLGWLFANRKEDLYQEKKYVQNNEVTNYLMSTNYVEAFYITQHGA